MISKKHISRSNNLSVCLSPSRSFLICQLTVSIGVYIRTTNARIWCIAHTCLLLPTCSTVAGRSKSLISLLPHYCNKHTGGAKWMKKQQQQCIKVFARWLFIASNCLLALSHIMVYDDFLCCTYLLHLPAASVHLMRINVGQTLFMWTPALNICCNAEMPTVSLRCVLQL